MKILINAGHGGNDPGAVGIIEEAAFNYDIANRIVGKIRSYGGDVADVIPSIGGSGKAVPIANGYGPNCILLSIHANSGGGTGYENFFADGSLTGKTEELVRRVHDAYGLSGLKDRGIKPDTATAVKRLTILRDTVMPATLLEFGFVDSENDAALLSDDGFKDRMADILARELMDIAGQTIEDGSCSIENIDEGEYLIVSESDGRALDMNIIDDVVNVWQVHGNANQRWLYQGGRFINKGNGMALDVYGGSKDQGARLIGWHPHGGDNQQFFYTEEKYIVAKHSGLVLDIEGGRKENGSPVIQWRPHGKDNQKWNLVRLF